MTTEGFDTAHFDDLAATEDGHFWHRARRRLILWALEEYFPTATHDGSFLEIGCGTGFVLSGIHEAFPQMHAAGSEMFDEGLVHAKRRLPGISLAQMDARAMPQDSLFDVIGAFDVIEHIDEDTRVLAEMHRCARLGIVLTVPQHPSLWSEHDEAAHHVRRYTAKELREKVTRAGFTVKKMTSFVTTLLPPMWLSRRLPRSKSPPREGHEYAVNPLVNRVFENLMNVEIALIKRGAELPLGGSLMLVAQKT